MSASMNLNPASTANQNATLIVLYEIALALYLVAASGCLVAAPCELKAVEDESVNLYAQRIEAIKSCEHSADEPCPHGRVWHVDYAVPKASDGNNGSEDAPFKTISRAADVSLPGDTVLVAKGVYREHVSPRHSGYDLAHTINYVARERHQAVIKGSEPWRAKWRKTGLKDVEGTVWQTELDTTLFTYDFPVKDFNPFALGDRLLLEPPLYEPNRPSKADTFPPPVRGMIFMDGQRLDQARNLTDFAMATNTFFVSADGKSIYARFNVDPQRRSFEITTREQVFAPRTWGVAFIHVQGFVMEHGATVPAWLQYGMVSPGSVIGDQGGWHWIIDDNVIRWSNACGLDIGQGYWGPGRSGTRSAIHEMIGEVPTWKHWIKGNAITDNGQAGIWAIGSASNAIIEYNRIERNGWKNNIHHIEAAGLKMHGASGVVIRGNLVRDNDAWGLWLDVVGGNNRITQNLLIGNMIAGVMVEGVWGHTLVDNNISAFTRTHAFHQMNLGDGFYGHQSSHVTFAHNLSFANTGYGYRLLLWGEQNAPTFPDGKIRVSHNRILNNIAYANGRGAICLPMDQKFCQDNRSDFNFLWGASGLPLFELGRGLLAPSQMMATVEAAIEQAGVGPDQVPFLTQWQSGRMGPNVGDMRHFGPLVSMPVWQAAQGRDLHSVIAPLPNLWMTHAGQMEIDLNIPEKPVGICPGESAEVVGAKPEHYRSLDVIECEPIPEVTHDYFGNPRLKGLAPTVGPFQDLKQLGQGQKQKPRVFLHLWPLDPSRQPPVEDLRPKRPTPELDEQEKNISMKQVGMPTFAMVR